MKTKNLRTGLFLFFPLMFLALTLNAQVRELREFKMPDFDKPASRSEARLQDLKVLEIIVDLNASYSKKSRARAKKLVTDIRSRVGSISELELLIEIHRALALADNAHDEGRFALFPRGWGSLPFRGYWFAGEYRIIRTPPEHKDLLGARVTHFDGVALDQVNVRLKELSSGSLEFFRAVAGDSVMVTPAVLHHMGIIPSPDQVEVHLVMPNGRTDIRIMKPSKPGREANPSTSAGRLLFPNFDLNGWSPVRPRPRTPLYLAGEDPMGEPFVYKELGDKKVPYFQLRQNFSTEKQNLPQFVKDIELKWKGRQFPFLIIDLRLNQGGNMLLTQKFFQSLDQYLTRNGKIYVPLGARTFSAGVLGAALIKHGNKKKVIFIGEDVGGREKFWSEVKRVRFPNSEMRATYSSALHDIKDGCNKRPQCYWWYFENANPAIGDLRPEIYVPTTFADYYSGKDPILNKIAELENIKIEN